MLKVAVVMNTPLRARSLEAACKALDDWTPDCVVPLLGLDVDHVQAKLVLLDPTVAALAHHLGITVKD